MERKRPTLLTAKGNKMTRDPARIEFAAEAIRTMNYAAAQAAIEAEFGVGKTAAQEDIAAARRLIALEFGDVVAIRAREANRLERLAEKAEGLADHASNAKDYQGAAALKGRAIQASKEIARLTGATAPRELKVTHSGSVSLDVELRVDAVLERLETVLPPALYTAWMQCLELIAEAQERGVFKGLEAPAEGGDDDDLRAGEN